MAHQHKPHPPVVGQLELEAGMVSSLDGHDVSTEVGAKAEAEAAAGMGPLGAAC